MVDWQSESNLDSIRNSCDVFHVYCWTISRFHRSQLRHWQLILSKLGFYFSFGISLHIDVSCFGKLHIDQLKIKHKKNVERNPFWSRHVIKNLPEKASIYAFMHLKLIGNSQGFTSSVIYKGIIASHWYVSFCISIMQKWALTGFGWFSFHAEAFRGLYAYIY